MTPPSINAPVWNKSLLHPSCLAAFVWLFTAGHFLSVSVFNNPLESLFPDDPSFKGVWSSSMATVSLPALPAMAYAGVLMGRRSPDLSPVQAAQSKQRRIRLLGVISSLSIGALALAARCAASRFILGVFFFMALTGFGLGTFYVLSIELLLVLTPLDQGITSAMGLVTLNLGTLLAADEFSRLVTLLGPLHAVYASSILLAIPCLLFSLFVRWPVEAELLLATPPSPEPASTDEWEGVHIAPRRIPKLPMFWIFASAMTTLQAGGALNAFFIPIAESFGEPASDVIVFFQMCSAAGLVSRVVSGFLIRPLRFGEGRFALGARNLMVVQLVLQAIGFAAMWFCSANGMFAGFALSAGVVMCAMSGSATIAPVVAREVFGTKNGAPAFGMAFGVAYGIGEFAAMSFMALTDHVGGLTRTPGQYGMFYGGVVILSLAMAGSSLFLQRSDAAGGNRAEKRNGTASMESVDETTPLVLRTFSV